MTPEGRLRGAPADIAPTHRHLLSTVGSLGPPRLRVRADPGAQGPVLGCPPACQVGGAPSLPAGLGAKPGCSMRSPASLLLTRRDFVGTSYGQCHQMWSSIPPLPGQLGVQ